MRENSRHLAAFAIYFQLGPGRSQKRLHAALSERRDELGWEGRVPSIRTLERWSSDLHWQDRIDRVERESAQNQALALVDERGEALKRRRKTGLALLQTGLEAVRYRSPRDWPITAALRAIELGTALEVESIGAAASDGASEELRELTRRLDGYTDEELERHIRG